MIISVGGSSIKARAGMNPDGVEVFPASRRRHSRGSWIRHVRPFVRVPDGRPGAPGLLLDDHFVEAVNEDAPAAVRAEPGRMEALAQPRLVSRMTRGWSERQKYSLDSAVEN